MGGGGGVRERGRPGVRRARGWLWSREENEGSRGLLFRLGEGGVLAYF